jgi:hypothetical protein
MSAFIKDAADVKDYILDWSKRLGATDTIATSEWEADTGLTIDSDTNTDTTTTIWVSGGTVAEAYKAYNTVVTTEGRSWTVFLTFSIQKVAA